MVRQACQEAGVDAFGGPDRAHDSFTNIQKAINYSMTSFFTTGGIRGQKQSMEKDVYKRQHEVSRPFWSGRRIEGEVEGRFVSGFYRLLAHRS